MYIQVCACMRVCICLCVSIYVYSNDHSHITNHLVDKLLNSTYFEVLHNDIVFDSMKSSLIMTVLERFLHLRKCYLSVWYNFVFERIFYLWEFAFDRILSLNMIYIVFERIFYTGEFSWVMWVFPCVENFKQFCGLKACTPVTYCCTRNKYVSGNI